jgi:dipeptidyl aminopeptidase/acylaminoacyl peptidase
MGRGELRRQPEGHAGKGALGRSFDPAHQARLQQRWHATVLLLAGAFETLVPQKNSRELAAELRKAGKPVKVLPVHHLQSTDRP